MAITISKKFVAEDEEGGRAGFGDTEMDALSNLMTGLSLSKAKAISAEVGKPILLDGMPIESFPHKHKPLFDDVPEKEVPKHVPDLDKPSKNWAIKAKILKFISENEGVHSSKIFEKFGQPCRFVLRQLRDNDLIVSQAISHGNRAGFKYFTREYSRNVANQNRASVDISTIKEFVATPKEKIEAKCLDEWHAAITQVRTGLDNDGEVAFDWDHMRKDWFEDYNDYKEFALAFEKQKIPAKLIGYDYTATIDNAGSVLTITSTGKCSEDEKT